MPFLTGFGKRKEIRYGTVFPGANLTDFPKLFVISGDSDIASELASGGGIAVTASEETTEVPFGLYPSSDPTSGDLILRAKFSPLTGASTGDVLGYIYYDAGETTSEDRDGVVSNGYAGFWPIEEDPSGSAPQILDWTSNANHLTSSGTMTSGDLVAAQVGNGVDLDGSDDSLTAGSPASLQLTYPITIEACIRINSAGSYPFVCGYSSAVDYGSPVYGLAMDASTRQLRAIAGSNQRVPGSALTVPLDEFAYVAAVIKSGGTRIILNDTVGTNSDSFSENTYTGKQFRIGSWNGSGGLGWLSGIADEVRVSSVERSAEWLAYAKADDFNNSDTFTLGPEEVDGGGGATTSPWHYYAQA